MFWGGPGEIKGRECGWCRVVQFCGVLACLSYGLLATPQGACSARKEPAKDGPGANRSTTWSFKLPRTHVINFSAPFSMVKQKHVAWSTVFRSYLNIRSNDDRDFPPKITFFRTLEIFREFGMCSENAQIPWDELNHQTKRGAIRTDWKKITFEPNTYFTLPTHSTLSLTNIWIARELHSLPRAHSSLTHHYRVYHHQHILHSPHTLDSLSHEHCSLSRTPFSPTNSLFPHTPLSNQYHKNLLHPLHTLDSLSRTFLPFMDFILSHELTFTSHITLQPNITNTYFTLPTHWLLLSRRLLLPTNFILSHNLYSVHIHQEFEISHTHHTRVSRYRVATISRFLKITSLFCRI